MPQDPAPQHDVGQRLEDLGARDPDQLARLLDAGHGGLEIVVLADRRGDELLQHRILEDLLPREIRDRRRVGGTDLATCRDGRVDRWTPVIRTDGAARHDQRRERAREDASRDARRPPRSFRLPHAHVRASKGRSHGPTIRRAAMPFLSGRAIPAARSCAMLGGARRSTSWRSRHTAARAVRAGCMAASRTPCCTPSRFRCCSFVRATKRRERSICVFRANRPGSPPAAVLPRRKDSGA